MLDAEAQAFLRGFRTPGSWFLTRWLPYYRETTEAIALALSNDRAENVFDTLWKRADNGISHAGQGVMKFDTVDGIRDEFMQIIRDIHADGSPPCFDRIVERFEGWKAEGRIGMVPRLLIARAFAGIHPSTYHTTVDASSHSQVLKWFVDHTGFAIPRGTSWATRAQALVAHMDRAEQFDDVLVRNMFPWFVMDQLRGRSVPTDIPPGHFPRPTAAFADLPPAQRVIKLRHNVVQSALFDRLAAEFGADRVWTEYPTGTGGSADAIVRHLDGSCRLYEIKIADTAAEVVRQAMGQLLEYSFRAGGLEPTKLFVVGEPPLDELSRRFLARLRADFQINIEYLRIELPLEPSN